MKKVLSVMIAVLLALSVVGCSQKPAETTQGAEQTKPQETVQQVETGATETDFPKAKTVATFFIGGSVGAGGDLNMRTLIRYMEPKMDITIVPQNVTGSRTIYNAVKNMLKEPANGYTYAYELYPHCVVEQYNPATKDNCFSFDDLYLLCNLVTDASVIAVRANDERFADVNDFSGLVDYLKTTGETLLISACSVGGDDDITVQKIKVGAPEIADQLVIVNGEGVSDGVASLLGGTLDIFTGNVGDVGTLVEDGSMKVISVFADERSIFLPDVLTAKECGYDIINSSSRGVAIHKDTPVEIREIIQSIIEEIVNDPAFIEDMQGQGYELNYMNPTEYRAWLEKEYTDFAEIAPVYGW